MDCNVGGRICAAAFSRSGLCNKVRTGSKAWDGGLRAWGIDPKAERSAPIRTPE